MFYVVSVYIYVFLNCYWVKEGMKKAKTEKKKPGVNYFCDGRRCGENLVVPTPRPSPNFKALKINILLVDLKTRGGGGRGVAPAL